MSFQTRTYKFNFHGKTLCLALNLSVCLFIFNCVFRRTSILIPTKYWIVPGGVKTHDNSLTWRSYAYSYFCLLKSVSSWCIVYIHMFDDTNHNLQTLREEGLPTINLVYIDLLFAGDFVFDLCRLVSGRPIRKQCDCIYTWLFSTRGKSTRRHQSCRVLAFH